MTDQKRSLPTCTCPHCADRVPEDGPFFCHTCKGRQQQLPIRIEVGRRYVWEPNKPHAFEVVTVRAIVVNEDGEAWVETVSSRPGVGPAWNTADRFQEACVYE